MMKLNKDVVKGTGVMNNFGTGLGALTTIVLVLLPLSVFVAALPFIIPMLLSVIVIAAGIGMIVGMVCLLGWVINLFKK